MTETFGTSQHCPSPGLGFSVSSSDPTGTAQKLLPIPRYNSESTGIDPAPPHLSSAARAVAGLPPRPPTVTGHTPFLPTGQNETQVDSSKHL